MKLLGIHILTSFAGESIIIEFPDGKWGVVDCFTFGQKYFKHNPTIRFLEEYGKNPYFIEFACLTHLHYDHFNGFNQLLDKYPYHSRLRSVWLPFARPPKEVLRAIHAHINTTDMTKMLPPGIKKSKLIDGIYEKLDQFVRDYNKLCNVSSIVSPINKSINYQLNYQSNIITSKGGVSSLTVAGISPSSHIEHDYFDRVSRIVAEHTTDEKKIAKLSGKHHNNVGLALDVTYGKTRILLGADIEEEAWLELFRDATRPLGTDFSAHFVKIGHHGSSTACPQALLDKLSRGRKRPKLAVATHFKCGNVLLPQEDGLSKWAGTAKYVGVPIGDYAEKATQGLVEVSWDEVGVELLEGYTDVGKPPKKKHKTGRKSSPVRKESRSSVGIISAFFDSGGRLRRIQATPKAKFYTADNTKGIIEGVQRSVEKPRNSL